MEKMSKTELSVINWEFPGCGRHISASYFIQKDLFQTTTAYHKRMAHSTAYELSAWAYGVGKKMRHLKFGSNKDALTFNKINCAVAEGQLMPYLKFISLAC